MSSGIQLMLMKHLGFTALTGMHNPVLRFTLSTAHLFQSTGLAQPVPYSLSRLRSPDESQLYEVSQFLLLVLTHPRWLPEGCPYLRSTVAVLAIWGCVCMNVQPVTIKNICMLMVPLLENGHVYEHYLHVMLR